MTQSSYATPGQNVTGCVSCYAKPFLMEKTVSEAIAYRRSVRVYREEPIDAAVVRRCLENAVLAPNSSNLQLWEFIHVTSAETLKSVASCCFNQNAAKTARQIVVVVCRRDLWKQRAGANLEFLKGQFESRATEASPRRKTFALNYYRKLIPMLYLEFFGILGAIRYLFFNLLGLFRPVYRQVRLSDLRIVAHKSAALAAENFMVSMAAVGLDTCPMEGHDSLRLKKVLGLPRGAEINMVIGCGMREENGVYGPRFRIPFEKVYRQA